LLLLVLGRAVEAGLCEAGLCEAGLCEAGLCEADLCDVATLRLGGRLREVIHRRMRTFSTGVAASTMDREGSVT
jgi:hypothetical protein